MTSDYYEHANQVFRATRAEYVGCSPADFDAHELVVVPRPDGPTRKFIAMGLTFGTGTVLSVRDDYIEWVREHLPTDHHYRAMFPNVLLQPLIEEAARRGEKAGWRSPNLSFIPVREPQALPIPAGLSGLPFGPEWRDRVWPTGEFHNALGELDPPEHDGFLHGYALMDGDRIAAVAGAWDDFGTAVTEIGVDVGHDYRGRGLAPVVVSGLARLIADRGSIPSYYCAPTNVRSHRNAIASGFTPIASACRATPQP